MLPFPIFPGTQIRVCRSKHIGCQLDNLQHKKMLEYKGEKCPLLGRRSYPVKTGCQFNAPCEKMLSIKVAEMYLRGAGPFLNVGCQLGY